MGREVSEYSVGSEVFGTNVIKTDEFVLMAKVMRENGSTDQELMDDMELIDDLLSIQRMRCIGKIVRYTAGGRIRRDTTMSGMIDKRLNRYLEER
jgi:hypothetical protein